MSSGIQGGSGHRIDVCGTDDGRRCSRGNRPRPHRAGDVAVGERQGCSQLMGM